MDYHGFRSLAGYESECARLGFTTQRFPFHKGDEKYTVLVTRPPKTATSIQSWALFTADESTLLMDGVIAGD